MAKKGKKPRNNNGIVKLNDNLHEKLKKYADLTNDTMVNIVNNLLRDFFKDKILENDYITLDKPFYFNYNDLIKNKIVKATIEKPIINLNQCFIIYKVPNNLDNWNKKYNSYYSETVGNHKGILFYFNVLLDDNSLKVEGFEEIYLMFKYNNLNNELFISSIDFKDINLYVDNLKFLEELENIKDYCYNNLIQDNGLLNPDVIFYLYDVMMPFKFKKELIDASKTKEYKKFNKLINGI